MKIACLLLLLAAVTGPVLGVDYTVDPTFNHPFTANDRVEDVHMLPDGKMLVAGGYCTSSAYQCTPFVVRLNPDGSQDTSFSLPLVRNESNIYESVIYSIRPTADGKFLIAGEFKIGTERSQLLRFNADGVIDTTLPPTFVPGGYGRRSFEPLADGKIAVCGDRTIGGQLYEIADKLNADGTPDPTFRVNFIQFGYCTNLKPVPGGKILLAVNVWPGATEVKPLYRLNADGSSDPTFDAPLPVGSYVQGMHISADGKILINHGDNGNDLPSKRLTADGAIDMQYPLCYGTSFLPQADGTMFASDCRRWAGHFGNRIRFMKLDAAGNVDQTMDNVRFDGSVSGSVKFQDAGGGKYYVYAGFAGVQGDYNRRKLVRLMPNTGGKRAKFDFDGDGRSDLAVYRPSDGYWYIYQSTAGARYFQWGFSTDKIAAAHFDIDGKTDPAVFRDGTWFGWSGQYNNWFPVNIGGSGDLPMPGDFDDDGPILHDQAVRGVRSGTPKWFLREGQYLINQSHTAYEYTLPGELASDKPVVADFSGDSRDEFGYFQNGYWYTTDYRGYSPPQTFQWGAAGDIPVPGDYDGDRQDDYAVYRPSTGVWWINKSSGGSFAVQFGISTDIPVPADYDGDGKVDIAIYRNGQWWQYLSGSGTLKVENWGLSTDKPIPAQAQ